MREWAEKNFDINQTIQQVEQAIEDVAAVTSKKK
jgi:hypothetical protein